MDSKQRAVFFFYLMDVHQSNGLFLVFLKQNFHSCLSTQLQSLENCMYIKEISSSMTSVDLDLILSGRIWVFLISQWCYKLLNRHFMHIWQLWFLKVEWIAKKKYRFSVIEFLGDPKNNACEEHFVWNNGLGMNCRFEKLETYFPSQIY